MTLTLLEDDLYKIVRDALGNWNDNKAVENSSLVSLSLLSTSIEVQPVKQFLKRLIEELEGHNKEHAQVLKERYWKQKRMVDVSETIGISEHTGNRYQRDGIKWIAKQIRQREEAYHTTYTRHLEARLPLPTYTHFVGPAALQKQVLDSLLADDAGWLLALIGIGGIGKTSLANVVVRQAIRQMRFVDIAWIKLEPDTMNGRFPSPEIAYTIVLTQIATQLWSQGIDHLSLPEMQQHVQRELKNRSYLIVIDNLEDRADVDYLVNQLAPLVNPSKILFTTRARAQTETAVQYIQLDTLSFDDSAALMRHHAQALGRDDIAQIQDDDVRLVYDVLGGNPLAFKLVTSLLQDVTIQDILNEFSDGRPQQIAEMYTRIYWRIWRRLDQPARDLLMAFLFISDTGADFALLQDSSQLESPHLQNGLRQLLHHSMLEVTGSLQQRQYSIHRLTRTFLQSELFTWFQNDAVVAILSKGIN